MRWKVLGFTGEIGDVIDVCGGRDPERGGGDDVCEIVGEEEHRFLYTRPNHFVFGPYITSFFFREDIDLAAPSAETASCMVMTMGEYEIELTDAYLISALLDFFFNGEGGDVPFTVADENVSGFHWVYPILTSEQSGSWNKKTGVLYLRCSDQKRRGLDEDLTEQLGNAIKVMR